MKEGWLRLGLKEVKMKNKMRDKKFMMKKWPKEKKEGKSFKIGKNKINKKDKKFMMK